MDNRKQLRQFARQTYSAFRGDIIAASMICAAVSLALTFLSDTVLTMSRGLTSEGAVSFLVSLIVLLVNAPLSYGLISLLVKLTGDKSARWSDMFLWLGELRRIKASVCGQIWYGLISGLWVSLYSIPGFILMSFGIGSRFIVLTLAGAAVSFAGMLLAFVKVLSHMPGMYILADNPKTSVLMAFSSAGLIMKPHKKDLVKTLLAFIPLFIPYIVLLIPSMWITAAESANAFSQAAFEMGLASEVILMEAPEQIWYYISTAASTIYISLIMPYVHLTCIRFFNTAYSIYNAKFNVGRGENDKNE